MMWEYGHANWYYNTTGTPWQQFGSFTPDFREGQYFDIGIVGQGPLVNIPQDWSYFYQFGVASKVPVKNWTVQFIQPSFLYQGAWRTMEKAAAIQGDFSFWKINYRWGGLPYAGVTARSAVSDRTIPPGIVEFSYTSGTIAENSPLW
jgi:hypothetical protein